MIKQTTSARQVAACRRNAKKAGRKKGVPDKRMRTKESELDRIRKHVYRNSDKLIATQMSMAIGSMFILCSEKINGRMLSRVVRSPDELAEALESILDPNRQGKENNGKKFYMLRTDKPDSKALENLLDRAFGKPAQAVELSNPKDKPFMIRIDS